MIGVEQGSRRLIGRWREDVACDTVELARLFPPLLSNSPIDCNTIY